MADNLLASSPTLDRISAQVARFYGGEAKDLIPDGEGRWRIRSPATGKDCAGVIVRKVKGRYRFEIT